MYYTPTILQILDAHRSRTMPLAIIIGMSTVAGIYIAINVAYFVVLDVDTMKTSTAVASTFAEQKMGNFKYAIPFLVSILLIGSLNSTLFAASRYLFAAARQGHLPTSISCANPETDSPRVALFINVILAITMSFTGDPDQLISYVGFAQWTQRAVTMLVLLWIRYKQIPVDPEKLRMPIIMPILFFLTCASLALVTIVENISIAAVGMGVILGGFTVYFLFVFNRSLPSVECYRKYSSIINNSTTIWAQVVFNVMPCPKPQNESEFTQEYHDEKIVGAPLRVKIKNLFRRNLRKVVPAKHQDPPPDYDHVTLANGKSVDGNKREH
ncbi:hypothetical protein AB6A40_007849 [Gnathostoma spinigerum]|uniref:Uncharacterized protein n=1 Tax=Gnathostoma spinigerum TaxID=75299 RepID=A0ABD6EMF5_9BILA